MSTINGVSGNSANDPWAAMKAQRSQMQAKMFAKVDTDGSGGVDPAELQTMLSEVSQKTGMSLSGDTAQTFSKMDSNGDGSLSSDELGQGMQALMQPPSTVDFAQSRQTSGGSDGKQDDLFAKIDTNGDGSIDKTELSAFGDKVKQNGGKDGGPSADDMFAKLDTDGDSHISKSEFEAGKPQQAAHGAGKSDHPDGPPPGGGPGGPGGAAKSESANKTYDKLDTNQDGTVSELERLVGAIKDAAAAAATGSSSASSASNSAQADSDQDSDSSANSEATANKTVAKPDNYVDVAKLAKQIYQQIAAGISSTTSSLLSASA